MKISLSNLSPSFLALPLFFTKSESFCPQQLTVGVSRSHWLPCVYSTEIPHTSSSLSLHRSSGRCKTLLRVSDGSVTRLSEAPSSDGDEEGATEAPANLETPKAKEKIPPSVSSSPVSKFRKLKDIMWVREAVEDLTAAEFACSVESEKEESGRKNKRAVDYEKLLSQLNRRVEDVICQPFEGINGGDPEVIEDRGMGRFAYKQEQRELLLK
jgi:hypothetical protein